MKRVFVCATLILLWCGMVPLIAQDDQYLHVYNLMQQGDSLARNGQSRAAGEKYQEAQTALRRLQAAYPNWNEKIVQFRLSYLAEKVARLAPLSAQTNAVPIEIPKQPAVSSANPQLNSLTETIRRLENEKATLDAKLKEALAIRPAAVSPQELAKAEQKVIQLEKERDLLRVALDQEQSRFVTLSNSVRSLETDRDAQVKASQAAAAKEREIQRERDEVQKRIEALTRDLNVKSVAHQEEQRKGKELEQERNRLQQTLTARDKELALLQTQLKAAGSEKKIQQLELERNEAARQLEEAKKQLANAGNRDEEKKLIAQLEQSQKAREELAKKLDLANRELAAVSKPVEVPKPSPAVPDDIRKERDDFARQLAQLRKELEVVTARANAEKKSFAQFEELQRDRRRLQEELAKATGPTLEGKASPKGESVVNKEVEELRARVQAFEAKAVPFTPEELALFKTPEPPVAAPNTNAIKKSVKDLPVGAAPLIAEAERAFAARRFDEAEKKYSQVLRQDENNVYTLANLAAIQLEMDRLPDAEKNLQKALANDPDDAFTLSLLGMLRFRQDRYDDALAALSRSVQLNGSSAEAYNYLGITMSQKGQRGPAEAALRKAIQLQPDYASAHHNLAIIYATQQPAYTSLARWHYEKAVALGHPRNESLEKMVADKK
jgi:tetratricopeptide (TPR) repeat protein